jgi:hypothetical protein
MTVDTLTEKITFVYCYCRRSISIGKIAVDSLPKRGGEIDGRENAEKDEGEFDHDQEISSSFILLLPSTKRIPLRNNSETDSFSVFAILLTF